MNDESYILTTLQGEQIGFTNLLLLCRSIKAEKKHYYSIRRKLKKMQSVKFQDWTISRIVINRSKHIK